MYSGTMSFLAKPGAPAYNFVENFKSVVTIKFQRLFFFF